MAEVRVDFSAPVKKDDVIFKLDSDRQEAAVETARRKIAEVDAALGAAQVDIIKADAQIVEAKSAHQQASDELDVKRELQRRNPGIVPQRDIEKLEVLLAGRQGALDAATAAKQSAMVRFDVPSSCRESERRSRACAGTGRSGQNLRARGRLRACRAVYVAARRRRQSHHAASRNSDSRRCRSKSFFQRDLDRSKRRS